MSEVQTHYNELLGNYYSWIAGNMHTIIVAK